MNKIIYDEPVNQNLSILQKISNSTEYTKIFSDKISSNSIFYNQKFDFTVYLEIYAKGNTGCLRIKLFSNKSSFEDNSKEILNLIS